MLYTFLKISQRFANPTNLVKEIDKSRKGRVPNEMDTSEHTRTQQNESARGDIKNSKTKAV